ncbi:MAG: ATP-binding cassette domain-containing protein, partial [Anaerolineales bacterium]|nr:ATP-binding cassette domain-containing protein [Anaerolineales bacterium]
TGQVTFDKEARLAVLQQDQFAFDDYQVLDTVIMGHKRLYEVRTERDALYAKLDFSEEDGLKAADLEAEFAEMNGYEAEYEAEKLLSGLGITEELHYKQMDELEAGEKVRVLLAQALFGNPDILLLDEPTNNLDLPTIRWLEEFLINFENTVIVVSHDRHFLNNVCTHIADIDFGQIKQYVGNYDFWYQSSQMIMKQMKEQSKKREDKIAELQKFVLRFSANVAKAKQATSRKKLIEKLSIDELPVSSRKFPYVDFKPDRPCGNVILEVTHLNKTVDGEKLIDNLSFEVRQGDKIAIIAQNDLVKTTLFELIGGRMEPDSGDVRWGVTIKPSYFPKENSEFFEDKITLVDWLLQYAPADEGEQFARSWLGRMLFSGDEALKQATVLSGGEKVRCMLAKMMLSGANALVMDEPTNHLDLEAITALNEGLVRYPEVVIFASHDHEFVRTIANRIIEITPHGYIDRSLPLDEYLDDPRVSEQRRELGLKNLAL